MVVAHIGLFEGGGGGQNSDLCSTYVDLTKVCYIVCRGVFANDSEIRMSPKIYHLVWQLHEEVRQVSKTAANLESHSLFCLLHVFAELLRYSSKRRPKSNEDLLWRSKKEDMDVTMTRWYGDNKDIFFAERITDNHKNGTSLDARLKEKDRKTADNMEKNS